MTGPSKQKAAGKRSTNFVRGRRVHAARQLWSREQLMASFRMNPAGVASQVLWIVGIQAALSAALVLSAVHLSPWSSLIGYAGLGALITVFGGARSIPDRRRILLRAALLQTLSVLIFSAIAWMQWPFQMGLLALTLACGVYMWLCIKGQFGPPGPLIFIFAASASLGTGTQVIALNEVVARTSATGAAALTGLVILTLLERLRQNYLMRSGAMVPPAMTRDALVRTASWVAGSAGMAMFIVDGLGLTYPAWAGMGAVVVAQNRMLHVAASRTFERVAGGVLGALVAGAILWAAPSAWVLIAVMSIAMVITEGVIWKNYAVGQIFVTMMALLMVALAANGAVDPMMPIVRIVDTLVGVTIGILVTFLASTRPEREHLAKHHSARRRRR